MLALRPLATRLVAVGPPLLAIKGKALNFGAMLVQRTDSTSVLDGLPCCHSLPTGTLPSAPGRATVTVAATLVGLALPLPTAKARPRGNHSSPKSSS